MQYRATRVKELKITTIVYFLRVKQENRKYIDKELGLDVYS